MTKYFLFFLIFYIVTIKCEENPNKFSNKELENIGANAGNIISSSSKTEKANPPLDTNIAGDVMKGLKVIRPPKIKFTDEELIDPEIDCDRDYNIPCPNNYDYLGIIKETDSEICAPSSSYDGPCKGQELNIKKMSENAKEHWSKKCQTFWPCKKCIRNFLAFCPEKWIKVKNTIRTCEPTDEYVGPCNFQMNFYGFNIQMLQQWSIKCKAWWKCDHINLLDQDCPDKDNPISEAATLWRIRHNYQ